MHRLFYMLALSLSFACLLSSVSARLGPKARSIGLRESPAPFPDSTLVVSRNGTELPPYSTVYYFDQLVDHNDPSRGTFKQRYWFSYEFYEQGTSLHSSLPIFSCFIFRWTHDYLDPRRTECRWYAYIYMPLCRTYVQVLNLRFL